jgi:archaellum biogenesis ATPase FlaH
MNTQFKLNNNSQYIINFIQKYNNDSIEYSIINKITNKQISYFYVHINDVITNDKLDNVIYELYDDYDSEYDEYMSSYIFDDINEFNQFLKDEMFI